VLLGFEPRASGLLGRLYHYSAIPLEALLGIGERESCKLFAGAANSA
jgi:hypothetical protein